MNLTGIFKESICYPFSDLAKLIILGVLLFVPTIVGVITQQFPNAVLAVVTAILVIIFGFIVEGYSLSVIRDTIADSNAIPDFEWKNNFIDGLKLFVVEIVYGIVLAIIFAIVLGLTGGLDLLSSVATTNVTATAVPVAASNMTAAATPAVNTAVTNIPTATPLLVVGLILVLIIAIVAMFFMTVSTCRLAKSESIKEALSWSGITGDIKSIGVGRFVAWYILLVIVVAILVIIFGVIVGLLGLIPVVGAVIAAIITAFIIVPFFVLFSSRAMGLLYADA